MKLYHVVAQLALLLIPIIAYSQTLEETIVRDMKQYGYFVESRDTLGTRVYSIRDREPIKDPETFLAAVFSWEPPYPNAPKPRGDRWLMIMVEVAVLESGGENDCDVFKYALRSVMPLYCAAYSSADNPFRPGTATINLIHRIDPDSYNPKELSQVLQCMRDEWRKWAEWR